MIYHSLAFLAGVMLAQQQSSLTSPLAIVGLLLPLLPRLFQVRWLQYLAMLIGGLLWATIQAQWILQSQLPSELEGLDLKLQGVIVSLPDVSERRLRFDFEVERGELSATPIMPGKLRLSWYTNPPPTLQAGQRWRLRVRLKRPHGFYNPAGFDYQRWLYHEGIMATGYVRDSNDNTDLGQVGGWHLLLRWRAALAGHIDHHIDNPEVAALVRALVIGDRSRISDAQWERFRRTGTNHLMAISGLHIGIIAALFFLLGRSLWRQLGALSLLFPAPHAGAVLALGGALVYAALAGFSVSCVRALVMLGVVMLGLLARRRVQPAHSLAVALLLVLIWDSTAVLSAGFWLSFGAVAVIIYGLSGRLLPGRSTSGDLVRVQLAVSLGLAPLLLIWGLGVTPLAPLVNLLMVPLFALLLVPAVLLGVVLSLLVPGVGSPMLSLVALGLEWVQLALDWAARVSPFLPLPSDPPALLMVVAAAGIAMLLMPRGLPGRGLGFLLLMPLWLAQPPRPGSGELWVTMLDVGQGLSVVLQTQTHQLLYDTGPRFPGGLDTAAAVVLPYLQQRGIERLDRVILSNGDRDHSGGFISLRQALPIGEVISGEPERIGQPGVRLCRAGEAWEWDGVRFAILHPAPGQRWLGNNASCVLQVRGLARTLLIGGDIEQAAERALLGRYPDQLAADVVVVPHHGSKTSSSTAFVRAVGAEYGLISTGYRNRFGFPKPSVSERWRAAGTRLYNTATAGAIEVRLLADGRLIGPVAYRQLARRYWMQP